MSFKSKLKAFFFVSALSIVVAGGLSAESYLPDFTRVNSKYSYEMTNPYRNTGNKFTTLLESRRSQSLMNQSFYVGLFAQAAARYDKSNLAGQSVWTPYMRAKKKSSNVEMEEASIGFTGTLASWITAYGDLSYKNVYTTDVYASKLFVLLGDMDQYPMYLAVGKSYVPFGHFDSLSGIRQSISAWYFQTVSQNITLGYSQDGLDLSVSAMRTGKHLDTKINVSFRDTDSEIDAFAAAASYKGTCDNGEWYVGVGWMNQSSFDFEYDLVTSATNPWPYDGFHAWDIIGSFGKRNGAWDVNAGLTYNEFSLRGEYVTTNKKWPATDHKVQSYDLEASYDFHFMEKSNRFTISWNEIRWMSEAKALALAGSSDQKRSTTWGASWVAKVHDNLSAYASWDHYKGPGIVPMRIYHVIYTNEAPVFIAANNTKPQKSDVYKLGLQVSF